MTTYAYKLDIYALDAAAPVTILTHSPGETITLADPAIKVMTDLKRVRVMTIDAGSSVYTAEQLMKHAGVRLLVVVDNNDRLVGLLTMRDIMGEKPLHVVTSEKIRRQDLLVAHIMTPRSVLDPFNIRDVEHATVKDVILKMRDLGRQHVIIVEKREDGGGYFVRGLFSITQIGRQLGMDIPEDGQVQSFAEFEQILA
ncbi:MAG: CBS domain-containing protein [Gammaproteobacteria bacterium]